MHGSKPLDKALRALALAKALSKCGALNNFQVKFHLGGGGEKVTKDAFNSLYHYQIKHSVLVNFSISKNSALRALSALSIIVSKHAQWFRRGGFR